MILYDLDGNLEPLGALYSGEKELNGLTNAEGTLVT